MKRIEQVYAVLSYDPATQQEGIVAMFSMGAGWAPMVFTEEHLLTDSKSVIHKIATESRRTLKLVRFTGRLEMEEIAP